ncbi:hypothetical protein H5410_027475 [Solanum commersonii]|uniref:F-box associated beta-propeller type 1 domain-containing protein n=1 Tax=Solanum commersonii TaxID=4109 RepID=A0A9J5Z239_SOLCO|nr:hypothetical protein H5410_027475 [Solanum commersonii]
MKYVSKSWHALISSPGFIKYHLNLSANYNKYFTNHNETDLHYHMKNSSISFMIEDFINGLICLNDGYCIYGFGYDKLRNDYKVMCIFSIVGCPSHFQEVNIYSIKNDSWQIAHCSRNVIRLIDSGKFVNGKFYSTTSIDNKGEVLVLGCWGVGVLGINLFAICNNSTAHVDVWAMEEYEDKESMIKMFTINCALNPVDYLFSHSFYLSKRGEFLLMLDDTIMIYDPKYNLTRYSQTCEFNYGLLTEFFQCLICPLSQNESRLLQELRQQML